MWPRCFHRAVASVISLGFLVMHARCWPYADDGKNLLKLGSEVALLLVFQATAVMRSAMTKRDMVDAKFLREEDLTKEERAMPEILSVFMVLVSVLIPLTIFLFNKFKKLDEEEEGDDDTKVTNPKVTNPKVINPMYDDQDEIENPIAGENRSQET